MKSKRTPEEIYDQVSFQLETKRGLLKNMKNEKFTICILKAIKSVRLTGKSMLTGIKRFSVNIFS